MTQTLLIQYKDFVILLGGLAISLGFLLVGYALGRNSIDKPVVAVPKAPRKPNAPYHDNAPDMFEQALMSDPDKRIETV